MTRLFAFLAVLCALVLAPVAHATNPAPLIKIQGNQFVFSIEIQSTTTPYTIQWYFNSHPIPNATQPTLTIPMTKVGHYHAIIKYVGQASGTISGDIYIYRSTETTGPIISITTRAY